MTPRFLRGLSAALLLASTSSIALAADLADAVKKPSLPILTEFNPWMVRLRGLAVLPGGSDDVTLNGAGVAGGKVKVSNSVVPELDITYFFTQNIAAELILGTTPHRAKGAGALAGLGKLGSAWLLPPTLTLQYHFTNFGAFKPYVGAGVNYTFFYGEEHGALNRFKIQHAPGLALQAGFDYMINKNWGFNFDVKKLWLRTDATGILPGVGGGAVKAKMHLDPWLIGTGVTYKF